MSRFKPVLAHHGIKGMHWGVRRFQNNDGSYTAAGKKRYNDDDDDDNDGLGRTSSRKSKVRKVAAIIAGTAAIGATIYYAKKSGALDKGKDFVANLLKKDDAAKPISQWKPKADIVNKALASAQSANDKPRIKDNSLREKRQRLAEATEKVKAAAAKKQTVAKPDARKLVNFTFERNLRQRPDGRVDAVLLPKDKEGYAKAFAQQMTKGKTSGKDYDYWLKYMTSKLKT